MTQVFARYAKDLLEKQTYPEVRRAPEPAAGAAVRRHRLVARHAVRRDVDFASEPLPAVQLTRVTAPLRTPGRVNGNGPRFVFDYTGADSAIAVNRLLKDGCKVAFTPSSHAHRRGWRPRSVLEDSRARSRRHVL